MSQSKIVRLPDPSLRQTSQRIGVIDDDIRRLAKDMMAAALDWEDRHPHELGVAMAAIQLGQPYRLIVVRNDFGNKDDRGFKALINPEITKTEGVPELDAEGCLSVPSLYGEVPRYPKIKLKALDLEGRPLRLTARGFLARVLQHEVDHLAGKLFIDHVKQQRFFKLNHEGELEPLNQDEIAKYRFLRQQPA